MVETYQFCKNNWKNAIFSSKIIFVKLKNGVSNTSIIHVFTKIIVKGLKLPIYVKIWVKKQKTDWKWEDLVKKNVKKILFFSNKKYFFGQKVTFLFFFWPTNVPKVPDWCSRFFFTSCFNQYGHQGALKKGCPKKN